MYVRCAARSHVGYVRQTNEDGYAVECDGKKTSFLIIADGMGGHQAGEVASGLTVQVVRRELSERFERDEELSLDDVRSAILKANEEVFGAAISDQNYAGMGTTVVTIVTLDHRLFVGHIGDSRAYLLRAEGLVRLTEDHSYVNELVRRGQISPEEAAVHPRRNLIMRALGTEQDIEVDLKETSWNLGDRLLLCTDGLTDLASDDEIARLLRESVTVEEAADRLVDTALRAGGHDNVTVVVAENVSSDASLRGDQL